MNRRNFLIGLGAIAIGGCNDSIFINLSPTAPDITIETPNDMVSVTDFLESGNIISDALQKAMSFCRESGVSWIGIPEGDWVLSRRLDLQEGINIYLNGTVTVSREGQQGEALYADGFDDAHTYFGDSGILGNTLQHIEIRGHGIIQGNMGEHGKLLTFLNSGRGGHIKLTGITLHGGSHIALMFVNSESIELSHVDVLNRKDACNFMNCWDVEVYGGMFSGSHNDACCIKGKGLSRDIHFHKTVFVSHNHGSGFKYGRDDLVDADVSAVSFEECLFASGESSAISFHLNRSGVSCHDIMFNNCQILEGSSAITLYANHGNHISHITFNNIRFVTVEDVNQRLSSHTGHLMMSQSRSGSHDALVLLSEDPGGIQDIDFHDGSYRFWGETSGDDAYTLPSLSRLLEAVLKMSLCYSSQ